MQQINIVGDNYLGSFSHIREACRGIIINDNNILLSYETNRDFWMTPGGGRENNETLEECCAREIAEETGYKVKVKNEFVKVYEYYQDWQFINHYFICEVIGETQNNLTDAEVENGLEPRWIDFDEAVKIFGTYNEYVGKEEGKRGAYFREISALAQSYKTEK